MLLLGKDALRTKLPTRIVKRVETHPVLRELVGPVHTEIIVEVDGVEYTCSIDTGVRIEVLIDELERDVKRPPADYAARWEELSSNSDMIDRYVIIKPYMTSITSCALGVESIGLDPDDGDNFYAKVIGGTY